MKRLTVERCSSPCGPQAKLFRRMAAASLCLAAVVPLEATSAPPGGATPASGIVGSRLADFELSDWRGKRVSLGAFSSAKVVVLAVLGTECPLAKLYGPRLESLHEHYRDRGVVFLGINSNRQDSVTELAAYARRHKLRFPLLKDVGNRIADRLGAERTPEVFVLDRERKVRYRGRIDDQYGIDYARSAPRHRYLVDAIDALLAGRSPEVVRTAPIGCHIGRVREVRPDAEVTYYEHIGPILRRRCTGCHREGEIAPFELTEYDEVAGWADMIREVVDQNRMPPWHADDEGLPLRNDRRLSRHEKSLIRRWVLAGAPAGEKRSLPPLPDKPVGWSLPREPDAEFDISPRPVRVPAEGAVRYRYFRVPTRFSEEKWIQAVDVRPGNRAVVHHILVFVETPGELERMRFGVDGFLAGYVPGVRPRPFPRGMAKRIPRNATLVFQMHYTPVGTEQYDLSRIGFVFADADSIEYEVETTSVAQTRLRIPPRRSDVAFTAEPRRFPEPVRLLSFNPHMHLRGKSFRYELETPDGQRRVLVNIPFYDFNWQTDYWLEKPLDIPAGSTLRAEAHFDNSPDNLNNPDPDRFVRWGEQTWDEMMIGYVTIAKPRRR